MTTLPLTKPVQPSSALPSTARRLRWALSDAAVMTRRYALRMWRVPSLLVFSLIQPVMFVLLFRYVFGGAIHVPVAGISYVEFLVPGAIVQTAAFSSIGTAVGLSEDLGRGLIDRIRAMPTARSAVLVGRLASDTLRSIAVVLVLLAVGYLVGFRFLNGFVPAVGTVALAVLFGLSICCIGAFIGLTVKDPESVQAFGLIWLFPLTFISAAFVPVQTMSGWMQAIAYANPVTVVVDAMRAMAYGGPIAVHLVEALAWVAGILLVFGPLAVRAYRRAG
jgi:ABC-2 type transport system permease protein